MQPNIQKGDWVEDQRPYTKGEKARVTKVYYDKRLGEWRANTTRGNVGIDYIKKIHSQNNNKKLLNLK